MEQVISDHLLRLQEKESESRKEIEELRKEQDRLTMEKAQLWDCRVRLEHEFFISCQEVPEITADMDAEEKEKKLE